MLKLTRDKDFVKYVEWNGMEIYCQKTDGWSVELCLSSDRYAFGRFFITEFSLDNLQAELDTYYSDKTKCKRLLVGVFIGEIIGEYLYPGYVK